MSKRYLSLLLIFLLSISILLMTSSVFNSPSDMEFIDDGPMPAGIPSSEQEKTLQEMSPLSYKIQDNQIILYPSGGDDTDLINAALNEATTNDSFDTVVLNGSFIVSARQGFSNVINMKSNVTLEFMPDSKVTLTPNSFLGYYIIGCVEVNNFKIINPYIIGDRESHTGTKGEWGHGVLISGCKDFEINNLYVEQCWGDGINIGNSGNIVSENGYIDKIQTYKCRRNGVTFASGRNIQIDNINSEYTDGTEPYAALDIESNSTDEVWEKVKIGQVKSYLCKGGVKIQPLEMANYAYTSIIDITIDQVEIKGNDSSDTGSLLIDGVDYEKITGKVHIGNVLIDKTDLALDIERVVNGGISVDIDSLQIITSKSGDTHSIANRAGIYIDISSKYRNSKNVGSININNVSMSGDAEYFANIIAQQKGNIEKSNLEVKNIEKGVTTPTRVDGYLYSNTNLLLTEVNVSDLFTKYNPGQSWFTNHFLATTYHNENANKDLLLSPANGSLFLRNVPITLENRNGKYYIGLIAEGNPILPVSSALIDGFKSNEKGAKIKFVQDMDGTIHILEKVGNWVSYD